MIKGLEALQEMRKYGAVMIPNCEIIEKELKRLEELEKAFVALSKDDEKAKKLLSKEIEKNRAFEIIKNRLIDVHDLLVYDTYSSFNQRRTLKGLTPIPKEEYDILKGALL